MKVTKEFIRVYDKIFSYIYLTYGPKAFEEFLKAIAPVVFQDLVYMVNQYGLKGCVEYWMKTLAEEGIKYEVSQTDNTVEFKMEKCESLASLERPFILYCNHCKIMYPHILKKHGLEFTIEPNFTQGTEARQCTFRITQKPSSSGPVDTQSQSKPQQSEQT